MNNDLQHHGIKGQKWGVRKYQNKDGSLTAEGKKRYGTVENYEKARKIESKKNIVTAKNAVDALKGPTNELGREVDKYYSKKQRKANAETDRKIQEQVRKMSDEELRIAVNRLNMEERYSQVMQQRSYINVGESVASKFFDRTATALTLTSTALSIALLVKELKK